MKFKISVILKSLTRLPSIFKAKSDFHHSQKIIAEKEKVLFLPNWKFWWNYSDLMNFFLICLFTISHKANHKDSHKVSHKNSHKASHKACHKGSEMSVTRPVMKSVTRLVTRQVTKPVARQVTRPVTRSVIMKVTRPVKRLVIRPVMKQKCLLSLLKAFHKLKSLAKKHSWKTLKSITIFFFLYSIYIS